LNSRDGVKATVYHGPGDVRVEQVPDPTLRDPTDAIVRVSHACICGSDLWPYRGQGEWQPGARTGHELMGIVDAVGPEVRTLRKGDRVMAPFAFSDGTCEFCREGLYTSCVHAGFWGGHHDGGQGEAVRAPFADGTLVKLPADVDLADHRLAAALATLTDVMGTGHHAARLAHVSAGGTAVVVGDGAVGLCGVLAARRLGAERIIVLGHHEARLAIAKRFGATDVVKERGVEAIAKVKEMTGFGAHSVLECVGTQQAMDTAVGVARPGGSIGYVGVPHVETVDFRLLFRSNIALKFGVAPVRAYQPELLAEVLAGRLDPSPVLDFDVDLDGVPKGYEAMDSRRAIKTFIRVA
jgi:threonine dehydrogenase-like Zn-dependent dehydrogenase